MNVDFFFVGPSKILQAVSRKLTVDPDLRLEEIANLTEGFTGADLQALVYAAHLAVVHEQIAAESHLPVSNLSTHAQIDWCEILPTGSLQTDAVKSREEEEDIRTYVSELIYDRG